MIKMLWLSKVTEALTLDKEYQSSLNSFVNGQFPLSITGLKESSLALFIKNLDTNKPMLFVVDNEREAIELSEDFQTFGLTSYCFPASTSRLYQASSGAGSRSAALLALRKGAAPICIITLRQFMRHYPSPSYLSNLAFDVSIGENLRLDDIAHRLTTLGYNRVSRVTAHGEFALRGEVIDLLMPMQLNAIRLVIGFDELEEIKYFDINNQMSLQGVTSLTIVPNLEALFSDDEIKDLEQSWNNHESFKGQTLPTDDLRGARAYVDSFMSLLWPEPFTILDYLSSEHLIFFTNYEKLKMHSEGYLKEANELYRNAIRSGYSVPTPNQLISSFDDLTSRHHQSINLKNFTNATEHQINIHYEGPRSFFGNLNFLKEELSDLAKSGYIILIFAQSDHQAMRISTILSDHPIEIVTMSLSSGFSLPKARVIAICEHEIFGRKKREITPHSSNLAVASIDSFIDLNIGDYVVHINHGVGQFTAISRLKTAGSERDYIVLNYADDDTIFIPIEQVNMVQRFIGNSGDAPKLDRIGGKAWSIKKSRASKSAEDLADYLVDIYARRQEARGFAYPPDDEAQLEFEADFPYLETVDQLQCMEEIKADMQSIRPMDRLVCGDVGYGKTELAMRSAFKAAMAGRQVAILCPTTILAEQHFSNFLKRFERFPFINIRLLSRFVDKKDQKETIEGAKLGNIDIIIGTHRLLSKDITFKNLGLLIIDEEQRFGVKDKEKIKRFKSSIDSLALSATPIPRTLHMSMVKIRDLSTLKTAPANRRPVETIVDEYNTMGVTSAIRRELSRGGQVFYLHNRVESLEATRNFLGNLVPEAMIEIAHGQMNADELDDVMHRFIHGGFSVLVSTTIIESGIDIPNVNTIIIDRADMYGISQLYQLRGRVGRSDRSAFAYLFYPQKASLSELAMKRLKIISDFTELGSGFKIAMKDMEIRGAGNLLGRDQSGQIQAIGFDLYLKMINIAVRSKTIKEGDDDDTELYLELDYSGFIPESYIDDIMDKMEIYKKIAAITGQDQLDRLYSEITDRFGPIPEELLSLFSLAEIGIIAKKLKIIAIREHDGVAQIEFGYIAHLDVDKIMRLIKESGGKVKPDGTNPAALLLQTGRVGLKEKSEFIRDRLSRLI